jgi:RNA-binding protein 8A
MEKEGEDETIKSVRYGPLKSVEGWVIFVTGLNEEAQEDDITDTFSEHGNVKLVKMNFDRKTGRGKGYALVEYGKQSEAQDAINNLHGTHYLGMIIGVHWAFVKPTSGGQGACNLNENRRR